MRGWFVLAALAMSTNSGLVHADPQFTGQWRGSWVTPTLPAGRWASQDYPTGANFEVSVFSSGSNIYGQFYVPELTLFDAVIPAFIIGNEITFPLHPSLPLFVRGYLQGDGSVSGFAQIPHPLQPDQILSANWQMQREINPVAGEPPGPECDHDVPLYCTGDAEHCSEIVSFSPPAGIGYLDYPVRDETGENQYRSFVRRDLAQIVQFAAAELECKTADWAFGNKAPVGLGDGSKADGTAPTFHKTHTLGSHLDIAYPQLYSTDNLLRHVGRYITVPLPDDPTYLIGPPAGLDALRTTLFITYLGHHPILNYVVVDEEAGLLIESAFDELEDSGWIPAGTRDSIRLLYKKDDVTAGHTDHMHISMRELEPVVETLRILPRKLQRKSGGQFVTAELVLADGVEAAEVDFASLRLILDGHTLVRAEVSVITDRYDNILTVKFDRASLTSVLEPGNAELTVIGSANDVYFQNSDTIFID